MPTQLNSNTFESLSLALMREILSVNARTRLRFSNVLLVQSIYVCKILIGQMSNLPLQSTSWQLVFS